jgi:hypothetical protein
MAMSGDLDRSAVFTVAGRKVTRAAAWSAAYRFSLQKNNFPRNGDGAKRQSQNKNVVTT